MVAAIGDPAGHASVKVVALIVAGDIAWSNVTDTPVFRATPVTMGVLTAGDVVATVGTIPMSGLPRMGSSPPPQPATKVAAITATGSRKNLSRLVIGIFQARRIKHWLVR